MKRKLFNPRDRYDLHKLGGYMNAKFKVEDLDDLDDDDVRFCRAVMYWHDHYIKQDWTLPTWAQMPDFQGWLNNFRSSYQFYITYRNGMDY